MGEFTVNEIKMSDAPAQFLARSEAVIDEAMEQVHALLAVEPRESVMANTTAMFYQCFESGQLAPALAAALIKLADEQGSHAMTASNFNDFTNEWNEDRTRLEAEINHLGTALEAATNDRDEALAKLNVARDMRDSHFEAALEISEARVRVIAERDRLAAQVARSAPVVAAALAWYGQHGEPRAVTEADLALLDVVSAYSRGGEP